MCKRIAGINILVMIIIVMIAACSSNKFSYKLELISPLKDNGFLKVGIEVAMKDQNGVKEVEHEANELKRAFSIIFREYRSKQLIGTGRGTVTRVLEKIFDSKIRSQVETIKIISYEVREPKR